MAQKFTVPITVKQLASAGSDAVTVYVDADAYARLKIEAGGRLTWGSGASAGDVNLYRDSADVLKTDDTLKVPTLFVDSIEIDTTGATTNQILKFDGTKFAPGTGGGSVGALDDLSDVVVTSPAEFQSLVYDGTNWVNTYASTVTYVRNAEATTLTTGTVVYLFGATGDHATVKRADNDSDTTSSKTVGLVAAPITASNNGPVITRGYVDGINLSVGYASGDVLWLGEDGAFTKTKPTAPEHLVFVGVVVRATNNGIVYVATQNGYELDELHDVSIVDKTSGDFLKYNGSLWVNDQINLGTDTTGDYVQSLVAGTGVTLTNNSGESATPTVAVDTTVIQARVTNVTDTEIGYLDGVTSAIQTQIDSKLATSTASTTYAPLASPTFTGTPTLPTGTIATTQTAGNNTTAVATTAFVTTAVSGATVVVSSATAPVSPTAGLVWFDTTSGASYIYYNSAWIELGGGTMSPYQVTSPTRPASPWIGQHIYETDTKIGYQYDGTNWGPTYPGSGFRNVLINGDMRIAQRGTATITGSGSAQYPVDRWVVYNGTGTVTFVQSTDAPAGFTNSILATVTATGSYSTSGYTQITHKIEGFNCQDLAYGTASAKTIILSFWVKSSVVGIQNVSFKNSGNNRVYIATYTVDVANTWEKKIISVVGDTTGTWLVDSGIGLEVTFNLGMGTQYDATAGSWQALAARYSTSDAIDFAANSGATWRVTGVQLEANPQATPFEQRPIGVELALCQRYYQKSYNDGVATGTNTNNGLHGQGGFGNASGLHLNQIYFKVDMRTTPTISMFIEAGTSGYWTVFSSPQPAGYNGGAFPIGQNTKGMVMVVSDGGYAWQGGISRGHWEASAEL